MAEKLYSLYTDTEILDQRLAVEIGDAYVVLLAGSGGQLAGLEYYSTEDDLEESLEQISHQSSLLNKQYSETKLFYNFNASVLVPVGYFNTSLASEFVDLAFGSDSSRVNVENINIASGILNVYRSNDGWQEIIGRYFRAVTKRHLYSKLVEQAMNGDEQLRLIFYPGSFVLVAVKGRQLKIVRGFEYSNDADVMYHVLNACRQSDIVAAETTLHVCGIIEKESTVLGSLRKYFDRIRPDNISHAFPLGQQDKYPAHYFSSFFNLLS